MNGRYSIYSKDMAQQAVIRPDPVRELHTESLRLTAFLAPSEQIGQPTWWSDLIGSQPETKTAKPSKGELQEAGPLGEGTLVLSVQPGRVDWVLVPRFEEGVRPETRWAGRFAEATELFSPLMIRWLANCPAIVRLAFGAIVHQSVRDRVEAYGRLAQYLPAVDLDAEHSEDFIYQINRPRNSAIVQRLKINRLNKWSAALFVGVRFDLTKQVIQQHLTGGDHTVRIELDINTDPGFAGELPRAQLPDLFGELKNLAVELTERGDVP